MNRLICAALAASFATPALAQQTMPAEGDAMIVEEDAGALDRPAWDTGIKISVLGGYEYQMDAGLEYGGRVAVHRGFGVVDFRKPLRRDLTMTVRLAGEAEKWNFSGSTIMGGINPWDDTYNWLAAVSFDWAMSDEWTVHGGPILRSSYEGGADVGDSITGGGFVAASYRANDDLLIGGGFGVVSQIEDSAQFFPVLILEWEFASELTLESRTYAANQTGLQVRWDAHRDLSLSAGAVYMNDRFRLNSSGFAADGVVEEESLTFFVRAAWSFSAQSQLVVRAGLVSEGELNVNDLNGDLLLEESFDETMLIGVSFRHQF